MNLKSAKKHLIWTANFSRIDKLTKATNIVLAELKRLRKMEKDRKI